MENLNNNIAQSKINGAPHQTAYVNNSDQTYFAQPYCLDAIGFFFTDFEDYTTKAESLRDSFGNAVEEFELQYIDGVDGQLFNALSIDQANIDTWFGGVVDMQVNEKAALFYLVSVVGYKLIDALDKIDDVCLYTGNLIEAATDLFEECYSSSIPEHLRNYIDFGGFARDCELSGDMCEFDFMGDTYTCTNAAGI